MSVKQLVLTQDVEITAIISTKNNTQNLVS